MKKTTVLFGSVALIGSLLIQQLAHAQGSSGVGGGGDFLSCPENGNFRHYVLDTYEEKEKWTIDAGKGATLEERVFFVLKRLASLDPVRAKRYVDEAGPILKGMRAILENRKARKRDPRIAEVDEAPPVLRAKKPLRDVDDAGEKYDFVKAGCVKKQLALQEMNSDTGQPDYTFDFELLEQLEINQQVAIVLHEIVYHELRDRGATISKQAREYNRLILDPRMEKFPSCQYATKTENLGFGGYSILGVSDSKKRAYQCDDHGNIRTLIDATYPFFGIDTGSAGSFPLAALQLKDGRLPVQAILGDLRFGYPKVGKPHVTVGWDLTGGRITFASDGTLVWSEVRKDSDTGVLRFVTDARLRVLSIQDEGYFNGAVDPAVMEVLTRFAEEVKRLEPSYRDHPTLRAQVVAVVTQVRREIPSGDLGRIQKATQGLSALSDVASATPTDLGAEEWLTRLSDTRPIRCLLTDGGLVAGLLAGVRIHRQKLECLQANGDVRQYVGRLRLDVGMGFLGGVYHQQSIEKATDGIGKTSVTDDANGLIAIGGPFCWNDYGNQSWAAGVGFYASFLRHSGQRPVFKVKQVISGTYGLAEALTAKILVDRAQYPKRQMN